MRAIRGLKTHTLILTAAWLALAAWPGASAADDLESQAKRARGGAGLRAGTWLIEDLNDPPYGKSSETASFEGWFQKGMDLHIAIENTIGFWQRKESSTEPSGGFGGFSTTRDVDTYLVPTISSLKLYPFTRPAQPFEAFMSAGLGAVLRIQREEVTSTDPLVLPSRTTSMATGLGIQTGAGIEWNPSGPFGLRIGGHYQWATFGEQAAGKRMYRGPGVNAGVTYRFRYQ